MGILLEQTVFPAAVDAYDRLASVLAADEELAITSPAGEALLPLELQAVLRQAVAAFRAGEAVSVMPRQTLLTTQEAADLLNISRPTLIKILEGGAIPYEKRGRHRKVLLNDVLSFQTGRAQRRRSALDEMARDADEYRDPTGDQFVKTR